MFVGPLGLGSSLHLEPAFSRTSELNQLRMFANLLPVAGVHIHDDVVAGEDTLVHLGHDLGQGEGAVVEFILLHQPALVLLGEAHGIGDTERLPHGHAGRRRPLARTGWAARRHGRTEDAP